MLLIVAAVAWNRPSTDHSSSSFGVVLAMTTILPNQQSIFQTRRRPSQPPRSFPKEPSLQNEEEIMNAKDDAAEQQGVSSNRRTRTKQLGRERRYATRPDNFFNRSPHPSRGLSSGKTIVQELFFSRHETINDPLFQNQQHSAEPASTAARVPSSTPFAASSPFWRQPEQPRPTTVQHLFFSKPNYAAMAMSKNEKELVNATKEISATSDSDKDQPKPTNKKQPSATQAFNSVSENLHYMAQTLAQPRLYDIHNDNDDWYSEHETKQSSSQSDFAPSTRRQKSTATFRVHAAGGGVSYYSKFATASPKPENSDVPSLENKDTAELPTLQAQQPQQEQQQQQQQRRRRSSLDLDDDDHQGRQSTQQEAPNRNQYQARNATTSNVTSATKAAALIADEIRNTTNDSSTILDTIEIGGVSFPRIKRTANTATAKDTKDEDVAKLQLLEDLNDPTIPDEENDEHDNDDSTHHQREEETNVIIVGGIPVRV